MPLFTMPKKLDLKEDKPKDDNLYIKEDKPQETKKKQSYTEDFAYCNYSSDKFYYIANSNNLGVVDRFQLTMGSGDILVLFSIKIALDYFKMVNIKNLTIYSIYNLDEIIEFSKINDVGSMFRYKSREILRTLDWFGKVEFKKECPYPEILELSKKMEELK